MLFYNTSFPKVVATEITTTSFELAHFKRSVISLSSVAESADSTQNYLKSLNASETPAPILRSVSRPVA